MGGITKRGDRYLRKQLVHGARACQYRADGENGRLDQWLKQVEERRGKHKACVALAHKLARVIWAVLTKEVSWEAKWV
jgi:transposase